MLDDALLAVAMPALLATGLVAALPGAAPGRLGGCRNPTAPVTFRAEKPPVTLAGSVVAGAGDICCGVVASLPAGDALCSLSKVPSEVLLARLGLGKAGVPFSRLARGGAGAAEADAAASARSAAALWSLAAIPPADGMTLARAGCWHWRCCCCCCCCCWRGCCSC
eukprot:364612-Chlamydomonas_euryale.AAC.20